jgi:putative colanic acid biosynthesis acetyltransferase WcaF
MTDHDAGHVGSDAELPDARHISAYSAREKIGRMLWAIVQVTAFRGSFHNWYRWRAWVLGAFGAKVHPTARIRRTVRIECPWNLSIGESSSVGDRAILYCLGPVTIGSRVSISQHAHICAGSHDYTRPEMTLLRPPIEIESDAWIAADAFVGPNVTVGEGAILGARGVAFKNLSPWMIYAGNPARELRPRPRFHA